MNSTSSCIIQANSDITGVGVRVSMYALSLAAPIISSLFPSQSLRESIENSLGITGVALLLTAFVFAGQHKLDLFHSICLFHLIGLVGLTITPSNLKFRNSSHRLLVYAFFFTGLLGFVALVTYVLAIAPHFGTNSDCNNTIHFIVFGINIPATNLIFRCLFIANTVSFLLLPFVVAYAQSKIDSADASPSSDEKSAATSSSNPDEKSAAISSASQALSESASRIYLIIMIELLLHRNSIGPGETEWGFGQILSVMMLFGPLYDFIMELFAEEPKTTNGFKRAVRTLLYVFTTRFAFILMDFTFNAAAGVAAAATGAHVNGSAVTTKVVRLGALAGLISSGIVNFCAFVTGFTKGTLQFGLTICMTSFGLSFLVVFAIGQRALEEVPNAILIGSLAAAAPLIGGSSLHQAGDTHLIWVLPITALFDALGAYTFVRVSQIHGYHVCSGAAAAASGAVFGCIIWALRLPYTIIMGYRPPEGVIRGVIGKWRQSPQQEEVPVVVESEKVESTKV